jgi:hypothetical protein
LKKRINKLEDALFPKPLFVEPISAIWPLNVLEDTLESSSILKGVSSLLTNIKRYVEIILKICSL